MQTGPAPTVQAVNLFRLFRHGPFVYWLTVACIGFLTVATFVVADVDVPAAQPTLTQTNLLDDVSSLRGQLGSLIQPGQPEDAAAVAKSAGMYATRWAQSTTIWGQDAEELFSDIQLHAEHLATGEGDRAAELDAVLADADGLAVLGFGGDPLTHRTGADTHPALTELPVPEVGPVAEERLPVQEPLQLPALLGTPAPTTVPTPTTTPTTTSTPSEVTP